MILSAIQSAILRVSGVKVGEVFASPDQIAVEMADLSTDVATDIMQSHDWRALTKVLTITGTGATAYTLPVEFDRMLASAQVDDAANWFGGYRPFGDVNEWMRYTSGTYGISSPGGWIMLGGEIQFYPAPVGTAQFPYISKNFVIDADSSRKPAFTADTDIFVLDERLLTLGLIWRWNEQKGFDYAEAMQTYETALARAQGRDKGARVAMTPRRWNSGAGRAYSNVAVG
jgi:hypothetical protein